MTQNLGIGGNNPPAYDPAALEALRNTTAEFIEASEEWVKTPIDSDELAEKLNDQINGLRQIFKKADDARKEAKKPHDDAGKEVQAAFKPILDRITKCADLLKPKAAAYAKKKADEEAKRQREERERAAQAEAEAARALAEAEAQGSIEAQLRAEEQAAEAERIRKEAERKRDTSIKSASGGGRTMSLRSRRVCSIKSIGSAFLTFKDDPEVADLLVRLANRRANAAGFDDAQTIPGFDIEVVKTIA